MRFTEYGGHGIITIKLDCDNLMVTFFKDYKEILKQEEIVKGKSWWFYMYHCTRSANNCKIVTTDIE